VTVNVTLTLLLFGSGIVFFVILCVYRHKKYAITCSVHVVNILLYSTGRNADLKFLKMSQTIKKVNNKDCINANLFLSIYIDKSSSN